MVRRSTFLAALAMTLIAAAACSPQSRQQDGETRRFEADLRPVNQSGVTGRTGFVSDGANLTVRVDASGLAPRVHPQHLHGFDGGRQPTCPSEAADANGDGIIDAAEGEAAYGPVQVPLQPFPTAGQDGDISFSLTYETPQAGGTNPLTIQAEQLQALEGRHIVLHGLTVNGDHRMDAPVACGEIRRVG